MKYISIKVNFYSLFEKSYAKKNPVTGCGVTGYCKIRKGKSYFFVTLILTSCTITIQYKHNYYINKCQEKNS